MEAARPAAGCDGFGGGAVSHEAPTDEQSQDQQLPHPSVSHTSSAGTDPRTWDQHGGSLSAAEKSVERSRASAPRF